MDADSEKVFFVPRLNRNVEERDLHISLLRSFQALGYDCPTEDQKAVITKFLSGHDVFVVLPTGSGKSMCFVTLPFIFENVMKPKDQLVCPIVVVITPLTSLMKDQVKKYGNKGVKCAFIGDECSNTEKERIVNGDFNLLYASPESLLTNSDWRSMFLNECYQTNLVALVIDEVHCVESWGKEFRTEYANISELRSIIPNCVNLMALTATISPSSRKLTMKMLNLREGETVIIERSPNKKNIMYEVRKKPKDKESAFTSLVDQVKKFGKASPKTIIFCRTYKELTEVALSLINSLYAEDAFYIKTAEGDVPVCQMYSASTTQAAKDKILPSFTDIDGSVRIVVATIAFGMGLDAPNVRQVIHWGPSDSTESYLQESGRAGRDGESATAILYYDKKDVSTVSTISDTMKLYCGNTGYCRRKLLLKEFGCELENLCDSLHSCCDICQYQCVCDLCSSDLHWVEEAATSEQDEFVLQTNHEQFDSVAKPIYPSKQLQNGVYAALVQYRDSLCRAQGLDDVPLLFGKEIATGIPDSILRTISSNCNNFSSPSDFNYLSRDHATDVFEIVRQICEKYR